MAVLVTCQACGRQFRAKDQARGLGVKCPGCKSSLMVEGPSVRNHDVFISYSHKDKAVADAVCAAMEQRQVRCWIAPRDVLPGAEWGASIVEAIEDARVLILIFSAHSNLSQQVLREVERAVAKGVVILPLRIEDVGMNKNLEFFLSACHWLDALTAPLDAHLRNIVTQTKLLLNEMSGDQPAAAPAPTPPAGIAAKSVIEHSALADPATSVAELTAPVPATVVQPAAADAIVPSTVPSVTSRMTLTRGVLLACLSVVILVGIWLAFHFLHQGTRPLAARHEHEVTHGPTQGQPAATNPSLGGAELAATHSAASGAGHPSAQVEAHPIDLLALVRLPDAQVRGTWVKMANGMYSDNSTPATLRLPYRPTGEYDFKIRFMRYGTASDAHQILQWGGRQFSWVIGPKIKCGFEMYRGRPFFENASTTAIDAPAGPEEQRTSLVQVRERSITAYVDGIRIVELKTDYSDMSVANSFGMGDGSLGLASWGGPVLFMSAEVTPVGSQSARQPQEVAAQPLSTVASDVIKPGTVWVGDRLRLRILQRTGATFTGKLEAPVWYREFSGALTDNQISWRMREVRGAHSVFGGDDVGIIHGEQIDLTWHSAQGESGERMLQLERH